MVRAKFQVSSVSETSVILYPVTCGSEENDKFFELTPSGQIQLSTVNPDAIKQFEAGKEFYVDFTPAD